MPLQGREEHESLREPCDKLKSFSGTYEGSSQHRVLTKALGASAASSAVVTSWMRQAHRLASALPYLAAASVKPSQLVRAPAAVTSTSRSCLWPPMVRT